MINQELVAALRSRLASKVAELGLEELQQQQPPAQVPGPPTGQPQPPVDPQTGQPVAIDPTTGQPTTPPMAGAVDPATGQPVVDPAAAQAADPAAAQQPEAPPTLEELLQSGDPVVQLLVDMAKQIEQLVGVLPQVIQINKRIEVFQKAIGQLLDQQGATQPASALIDLNDKMAIEAGDAQAAAQAAEVSKKSSFMDSIPNPLVDGADPDDEDDDDSFAPAAGMMPSAALPPSTAGMQDGGLLKLSAAPDTYLQIGQPGTPSGSAGLYVASPRVNEIDKTLRRIRQN